MSDNDTYTGGSERTAVPLSEIEDLREHYDRGWVDDKTQRFIDHLDEIIGAYETDNE